MNPGGRSIRFLIGLWILAGLVMIGINGYILGSLLDQPLTGSSDAVRLVRQRFKHYQMLLTNETERMVSGMDMLARHFAPQAAQAVAPKAVDKKTNPSTSEKKQIQSPPVVLPVLAGIVTSRSTNGKIRRLALLDEGLYCEGDRVRELAVERITVDGVLLVKGNKTWWLKAPQIAFSLTTR